jgi:hypothetical protein
VANRERGEQRLVADDVTFTLRLTVEACCDVEDRSGLSLEALVQGARDGSVSDLRWIVWASLQSNHAAAFPTLDAVGCLMDAVGHRSLVEQLTAFLLANLDDDDTTKHTENGTPAAKPTWRSRYIDARTAGIERDDFWQLSLLELRREMKAAKSRLRAAWNRDITQAWYVAALSNQKHLPPLARLLQTEDEPDAPAKPQTWQEMKAMLKALTQESPPPPPKEVRDGQHVRRRR